MARDALSAILETKETERLATGFVFTEGPFWHPDGFYHFVDVRRSHLHRLIPGKEPELVRASTGEGNGTRSIGKAGWSSAKAATVVSLDGPVTGAPRS
jgi:gluconolactonase